MEQCDKDMFHTRVIVIILKIWNQLVFTPSTRTSLESWGRQLQNDIMCDALGFKGSVVGSGKVDNWSFRWNDVTPTGPEYEYSDSVLSIII